MYYVSLVSNVNITVMIVREWIGTCISLKMWKILVYNLHIKSNDRNLLEYQYTCYLP